MDPKTGPFSGPCFMLIFWLGDRFKTSSKHLFSDFPKNEGPHFGPIFFKNRSFGLPAPPQKKNGTLLDLAR